MKLIECRFYLFQLRALRAHAEIVSGAYKLSNKEVGCGRNEDGSIKFRPQTEEELLRDKVAEMNSHIRFAQECSENMEET